MSNELLDHHGIQYSPKFPKFAIGIPTLNRWDLLRPALHIYLSNFPGTDIFVLDNGKQYKDVFHDRVRYLNSSLTAGEPARNLGVAASWNLLCEQIFDKGNAFALILNDDITLAANEYEIGNHLHYQQGALFKTLKDWCAFAIPKTTFEKIGPFDKNFMAYYEDNDYERRMQLARMPVMRVSWLSPLIHRDNSTGQKDPNIYRYADEGRKYYLKKWGGMPGYEKFTVPFEQK